PEQLWQRLGHELEAATLVDAHRIRRRRRRHDRRRVTGAAGDLLQLAGQTAADPRTAQRLGDVNKRELPDRGPQMRHDDADPDQPPVDERTERDPTRVDVALEFVPLCLDGMFAVPIWIPGR